VNMYCGNVSGMCGVLKRSRGMFEMLGSKEKVS
jgi:hypothetical protein